jgi:hypothetical protein
MNLKRMLSGIAGLGILVPVIGLALQSPSDFEHGVIQYASSEPEDPVARLQDRMNRGEVRLKFDRTWGYLPAVLDELKISRSSQALVFSKTSLQLVMISPKAPRALYFNDDAYIGAVQGGPILEVAAVDPKLGAIFYTLSQEEEAHPKFEREFFACLLCHDSTATAGVPGFTMLSVLPDEDGVAIRAAGSIAMSDRTPFNERWGGWYVTGTHGEQRHWGNLTSPMKPDSLRDPKAFISRLNLKPGANVKDLSSRFDAASYLTPDSDLVALMVMTHQTRTHNLITKANYDIRTAINEARSPMNFSDTTTRIGVAIEPLLRSMLFAWEAELTSPISGTTGYAREFASLGPRDRHGRSLRDFDLTTRLFRHRLSYLIYSDAFNALPEPGKALFYRRLAEILSGVDENRDFAHIPPSERQVILEILRDTKPDFVAATLR